MKKLYHKDKPVAGLDISPTGAKAMAIDPKKRTVLGYGSIDLDPAKLQESIQSDTGYLAQGLGTLFGSKFNGHLPSNQVAVSVPTNRTYSRTMTVPASSEATLAEAVALEAEQYIPIAGSELYMDYEIIERRGSELTVLMSAVPKRLVEATVKACEQIGLDVVMVEPGMSAVARLITRTEEGHLPTIIVDIGAASTDIAVLDKSIRITGGLPLGGNSFTLDIAKKMKVTLENAHQLKVLNGLSASPKQAKIVSALEPSLKQIISEIQKMIRYYTERLSGDHKLEQVIIVGGGSNMPGLSDYLTNTLVMPVRAASPWQTLQFDALPALSRQYKPRYITAAGLACIDPKEIWQ